MFHKTLISFLSEVVKSFTIKASRILIKAVLVLFFDRWSFERLVDRVVFKPRLNRHMTKMQLTPKLILHPITFSDSTQPQQPHKITQTLGSVCVPESDRLDIAAAMYSGRLSRTCCLLCNMRTVVNANVRAHSLYDGRMLSNVLFCVCKPTRVFNIYRHRTRPFRRAESHAIYLYTKQR